MTYVVAIARWRDGCSLEDELPALAPALGLALYDARLKLASPPPIVVARAADATRAQSLLQLLRGRGHGAVACGLDSVPAPEQALIVRGFELQPDTLVLSDRPGRRYALPYAEIIGMFRTAEVTNEHETSQTERKKFALGRAALSGGLVRHKTTSTVEQRETNERQEALYVFRSTAPEPVVLRERELDYHGLGEHRGVTIHQSFTTLLGWLRQSAPHAVYDEQLLSMKRRADLASVQSSSGKQVVTHSNSAATQFAAYLLMHAYVQRQL